MTFPCIFVTLLLKNDAQKSPAQDAANMIRIYAFKVQVFQRLDLTLLVRNRN